MKMLEVQPTTNFKPKQLPSLTKYICYVFGVVCTRIDANMVYDIICEEWRMKNNSAVQCLF